MNRPAAQLSNRCPAIYVSLSAERPIGPSSADHVKLPTSLCDWMTGAKGMDFDTWAPRRAD